MRDNHFKAPAWTWRGIVGPSKGDVGLRPSTPQQVHKKATTRRKRKRVGRT